MQKFNRIGGKIMEETLLENELSILKQTVRSFVKEKVERAEHTQDGYVRKLSKEVAASLKETAKTTGLNAMGAKKEWGGGGMSLLARAVLYEEAAKHRLGLYHPAADSFGEELPSLLENCTQEQIDHYVKPAIEHGKGCFVAIWEEHEDNNVEKLTCQAIKRGNDWLIRGKKAFIEKMDQASFGVLLVNCLEEDGIQKPTLFILEPNDLFIRKEITLIDVKSVTCLTFAQMRIPDERRIGNVGDGFALVKKWLAESQVLLSARCLGIAVEALDYAKKFAEIRITRGKPLSEFPSIRTMIANGLLNLHAARLIVHDAAKKLDQGDKDGVVSSQMAKIFTVDTTAKIIDDALQIHGGAGFAGDLPIERWYKEIRIARVYLQKKETILEQIADQIFMTNET